MGCILPLLCTAEAPMSPALGHVEAWAQTLVLVYRQEGHGVEGATFELLRASLVPVRIGSLPAVAGGVSEVGGVGGARGAYRDAMLQAPFCYVITPSRKDGLVTRYSLRRDGSPVLALVGPGDEGLQIALSSPWSRPAGSDEICNSRPGAMVEVGYTAPVVVYSATGRGEIVAPTVSSVHCGRVRLSGVVGPQDYERQGLGVRAVVNKGIGCFRDHAVALRVECISTCCREATLLVVAHRGGGGAPASVRSYREADVHLGAPIVRRERCAADDTPEGREESGAAAAKRAKRLHRACCSSTPGAGLAVAWSGPSPGACELCGATGAWLWRGSRDFLGGMAGRASGGCHCSAPDGLPDASLAWAGLLGRSSRGSAREVEPRALPAP